MAQGRVLRLISNDPAKRKVVPHFVLGDDIIPAYPSQWFTNHPDAKSKLVIPKVDPLDNLTNLTKLKALIKAKVGTHELEPHTIIAFLYHIINAEKGKLRTAWTSFSRVIGATDAVIGLENIVDVDEQDMNIPYIDNLEPMGDDEILTHLVFFCAVYRIHLIDRDDYKDRLVKVLTTIIKSNAIHGIDVRTALTYHGNLTNMVEYSILMATVDMFMREFPKHPHACVRFGTMVARYRDCSALLSLSYLLKTFSIDSLDFAEWIWNTQTAEEYMRILEPDQEMDDPRSYSMYFMELGLSDKSPYSATVNPNLHFLIHSIGSASNYARSLNARFVGDPTTTILIYVANVFHYALGKFPRVTQGFNNLGKPVIGPASEDPESIAHIPATSDGAAWLGWLFDRHLILPEVVEKIVYTDWAARKETRAETIGRFMYEYASPQMAPGDP